MNQDERAYQAHKLNVAMKVGEPLDIAEAYQMVAAGVERIRCPWRNFIVESSCMTRHMDARHAGAE